MNNSKAEALQNIEIKIGVLKAWLQAGIPYLQDDQGHTLVKENKRLLEFVPSTVRQFNGWDRSQNSQKCRASLPEFHSNNNTTLSNHKQQRQLVEKLTASLKEKKLMQEEHTPESQLKRIQAEKRELIINLNSVIFEHQQVLRDRSAIKAKFDDLMRESKGNENASAKALIDLKTENEKLKKEISQLTKMLAKVTPLQKVKS